MVVKKSVPKKKTKVTKRKPTKKKKTKKKETLPRPLVMMIAGLSVLILFQAPSLVKRIGFHVTEAFSFEDTEQVELFTMGTDEVYVPSLRISSPLIYIQAESEVAYQRALQSGVVHHPQTSMVGDPGNAYFFGHSSDLPWAKGDYKTVFALLPEISIDEVIIVTDNKNHPYRYRTYETEIVNPDNTSVLDQFDNQDFILSLQTSYPVGTALQRFVVRARLVEGPSAIQWPEQTPE